MVKGHHEPILFGRCSSLYVRVCVTVGVEDHRGKGRASSAKAKHRQRLMVDIEEQQLSEALEQGLHLLWNLR